MKSIGLVLIISITYLIIGNACKEEVKIPDEAIRFRILANSNSTYDQAIKLKVKQEVEKELSAILKDVNNYDQANKKVEDNIDLIESKVETVLKSENYNKPFKVKYGNHHFPHKKYNGLEYSEGDYNALIITIGEGLGNNWWCVLFPPLCLIEAEESEEVEYKIFIKEILDKYL